MEYTDQVTTLKNRMRYSNSLLVDQDTRDDLVHEDADASLLGWHEAGSHTIRLLQDGTMAYPIICDAIRNAKTEVLIEMYWFQNDKIGTLIRDLLIEATHRGVEVRVIYDDIGSFGVPENFWQPLKHEKNADVRIFGNVAPWRERFHILQIWHRNHRKCIIIDQKHCFIGGLNIADAWTKNHNGDTWRDDAIEVIGPVAGEARALFWRTWKQLGGLIPDQALFFRRSIARSVWLLANEEMFGKRKQIRHTYLERIRNAKKTIEITSAYFLPDIHVYRALLHARRRGVKVRILIPNKNDIPTLKYAQMPLIKKLVKHRIQVFAYTKNILHAKTAVIDNFVTIGSFNLDHRSWLYNLECNIAVVDPCFADAFRKSFKEDLKNAIPLTLDTIKKRPLPERILGVILSKLHFLL